MTNTQLNQRVAVLLGWKVEYPSAVGYKEVTMLWMPDGRQWSPSTNLAQAMELWAEHRPANKPFEMQLGSSGKWAVWGSDEVGQVVSYTDLPRAITEAWCEAKEQEGK